ncbi:hypothetical protein ACSBR2_043094 [Camellia fascicularis]
MRELEIGSHEALLRVSLIIPKKRKRKTNKQSCEYCHQNHKRYASEKGSISCDVVYAFLIPNLVALLQLHYQNKGMSPFETHPTKMRAFFTTLSLYCSTLAAEKVLQTYHHNKKYSKILGFLNLIFGALSSLSLMSLCLPKSIVVQPCPT